jgi:hypothetical protein
MSVARRSSRPQDVAVTHALGTLGYRRRPRHAQAQGVGFLHHSRHAAHLSCDGIAEMWLGAAR